MIFSHELQYKDMKVIFAQGNPGPQYMNSRHNIGFAVADSLAEKLQGKFQKKPRFFADIAEVMVDGQSVLIVKPTTFYNDTGQSARLIVDYYKLNPKKDFLAVYDDLALPLGTIRTRLKGSDAGNNGVKSLNAHLGDEYARVRIGIFNEEKTLIPTVNFVLGLFDSSEKNVLGAVIDHADQFGLDFIQERFVPTKVSVIP